MKKIICTILAIAFATSMSAASNDSINHKHYNQDYCSVCCCQPCSCVPCDPCNPCGPVRGTNYGLSLVAIGVGAAAVAAVIAIIATQGDDSSSVHDTDGLSGLSHAHG